MFRIVVYERPRCHLCDDARASLDAAGIEYEPIDVSADQGLEQEYGIYVPVVEVDGRIVFHAGMDPADLPRLVAE